MTTRTTTPTFDPTAAFNGAGALASLDDAVQRVTDLNDRLVASTKGAGLVSIDAYEKLLDASIGIEKKVAAATHLEWVSTAVDAHTAFVSQLAKVYTSAARELLS